MRRLKSLVVLPWIALLFGLASFCPGSDPGALFESYTARLSERDHYNSSGTRLTTAAAIIRQDRANYHLYGLRDPEDQPDDFFQTKDSRANLEHLLENGRTTPEAERAIVNGTPLVRVDIYDRFITVTIVER
jgi:hypothetical protein